MAKSLRKLLQTYPHANQTHHHHLVKWIVEHLPLLFGSHQPVVHLQHLEAKDKTNGGHDIIAAAAPSAVHVDIVFALDGVQSHNHVEHEQRDHHEDG